MIKKSAFTSPIMLLAMISMASILALGGNNILKNYNTKSKVDNLMQHEERIKDAFVLYAQRTKGDLSKLKKSDDIVKFMLSEQLLPPKSGVEKEDIAFWLNNSFGEKLKVKYTGGAWINISSKIYNEYAKKYYLANGSKNNPSFTEKENVGHRYLFDIETSKLIATATPIENEQTFKSPLEGQIWKEPTPTKKRR